MCLVGLEVGCIETLANVLINYKVCSKIDKSATTSEFRDYDAQKLHKLAKTGGPELS